MILPPRDTVNDTELYCYHLIIIQIIQKYGHFSSPGSSLHWMSLDIILCSRDGGAPEYLGPYKIKDCCLKTISMTLVCMQSFRHTDKIQFKMSFPNEVWDTTGQAKTSLCVWFAFNPYQVDRQVEVPSSELATLPKLMDLHV